jgi:hypothetical protein
MSSTVPEDILVPTAPGAPDRRPARSRIVAFVPITIAILGVAAILVGRVSVHEIAAPEGTDHIDPIVSGSIEAR